MARNDTLVVTGGGRLRGEVRVPGDKSISHRAVMFAALADGVSSIDGCLLGEDVISTMDAMRAMGVRIDLAEHGRLQVHGVGVDGLRTPAAALDVGNSGTSMRLLCGILAGAGIGATLTGDASLSRRPMRRVADPLAAMGAHIETGNDGTPPLHIAPGRPLHGIHYHMPVASAQVKSALLLAGLFADGRTTVREPAPTRDHSERMFAAFGVALETADGEVGISGGQRLRATDLVVPADISSAAFFIVGAALAADSDVTLPGVGINPTRTGIIDILRAMNADIRIEREYTCGNEPVADLRVRTASLRGIEVRPELVPLAIDEFPAIFVAAACAEGRTVVRGAAELRHKESDRIAVMAAGLERLGVRVETFDDGIAIDGGVLTGGRIDAHGDHRIAMAFAMAALRAGEPIEIEHAAAIATSFPHFAVLAADAGLGIAV